MKKSAVHAAPREAPGESAQPSDDAPNLAARVLAGEIPTTAAAQADGEQAARPDGRRSRWESHRAARRAEFIDAAIIAVRRHGASVGMDQIAAVANTSKPVVYRYFADKNDLYRAVSQRVVGQVLSTLVAVAAAQPPPRELIHASVDAYLRLLEDNPELYRFVSEHQIISRAPGEPATTFATVVAELLTQQLGERLRDSGLDPALAHPWGEGIVGFIGAASLWWLDHRDALTREQLAAYLSALLWGGAAGVPQFVDRLAENEGAL